MANKVELDYEQGGYSDALLKCPCGDDYLHQVEVEAGWRPEDGDVTRTISNGESVRVDKVPAKNVSSPNGYGYRRQYIVIRFECEICGGKSELCIRQHKGNTYLYWVEK